MAFRRNHGKFEKKIAAETTASEGASDAPVYPASDVVQDSASDVTQDTASDTMTDSAYDSASDPVSDVMTGPAFNSASDPVSDAMTASAYESENTSAVQDTFTASAYSDPEPLQQPAHSDYGTFTASAYSDGPLPAPAAEPEQTMQPDYNYYCQQYAGINDDESYDDDDDEPGFFTVRNVAIILTTLLIALAIGAACIFGYIYFVIRPYADYDTIMPNVYCAGIELSGMTQAEAESAIEEALANPSNSVTVNLPDSSYTFCPEQEGIAVNAASAAKRAFDYMRTDTSAFGMYKAYKEAEKTEYQIPAESALVYSREDIEALAAQIAAETYVPATDSVLTGDMDALTVSLTLGTTGHFIDTNTITEAVCNAYDTLDFTDISLEYTEIPLDQDAVQALCATAAESFHIEAVPAVVTADLENHCINVTAGYPGYTADTDALYQAAIEAIEQGTYGTVTVNMLEVDPESPDIQEAYDAIACDPTEPYYENGDIIDSSPGYSLDYDSAAAQVAALDYGETATLTFDEIQPSMTSDEMRALLFRDTLASYDTPHTALAGRTTNLKLSCSAINGTVLNPGETFSFNDVVGERTAAKGYQEATVYVNGDSVGELGGGICQVASTMYYAALLADLEITVREPHMYFVTYVPGGLDATVYYGQQDFCFRNNTDYPIRINASVSGGYVHISYVGTNISGNYCTLSSNCIGSEPYGVKYEYSSAYYYGSTTETVTPYTGYTYEAYQYVYSADGSLLETNYLGISKYSKRDEVITIGTG